FGVRLENGTEAVKNVQVPGVETRRDVHSVLDFVQIVDVADGKLIADALEFISAVNEITEFESGVNAPEFVRLGRRSPPPEFNRQVDVMQNELVLVKRN